MKKTFRSILAGALALLAVSCYDDTDLQKKYGDLNDRVSAIENTLNAEVGGINDLLARIETLEGQIAAINVETKDGVTTLTLSNGSSVVLSKNGVLTIDDNGRWATVAADGTVTPLGAKLGDAIDFKVENGELKVSYDGTAYEATGVKISDYTAHVIGNIVPAEDGKSVAVTIGSQTLELPLVTSAVASLGLSRDNFYLYHGGEKTVEIAAEGLNDVYVMNQPAGWKASISDATLVIKAPKAELVEKEIAEEKGLVLVHATTQEGKCIVAKIEVSTGLGLDIECDKDGNLTITNAFVGQTYDRATGEMKLGFSQFYVGIADAQEFEEYGYQAGTNGFMYNFGHAIEFKQYQEVVYEVDKIQVKVPDLYRIMTYGKLAYASTSVIWVMPMDEESEPVESQLRTVKYTHVLCQAEVSDITHNSGVLTCNLEGATSFYAGVVDADYAGVTMEAIFSESNLWMYLQEPQYLPMWQGSVLPAGEYKGETAINLSDLNFGEPLDFDHKYYVYVFPYIDGTVYSDFNTQFAPYVMEIKTNALLPGGTAVATLGESQASYDAVEVQVELSEDAESVYYCFYTVEEWAELEDKGDADVFASLVENCYVPLTGSDAVSGEAESGETLILAAVAVGKDGKYGKIVSDSYTTLTLPSVKDENLTVDLGEAVIDYSSVKVEVTPSVGTKVYYYYLSNASLNAYATDEKMISFLVTRNLITEKTATMNRNMAQGSSINLVMLVLDADNNYNIIKETYTSMSYPYSESITIECVKAEKTDVTNQYTLTFNVAGADKIAVWSNYSGYLTSSFEPSVVSNAVSGVAPNGYQFVAVENGVAVATVSGLVSPKVLYATAFQVTDGALVGLAKTPLQIAPSSLPVVE